MSTPRDKGFETASWLFVWVVIAVIAAYAIRARLQSERTQLRAQLDKQVEQAMRGGQDELSGLEQDLKRKSRDAAARRRAELEAAWGGPIAAAFKNPDLSLRDALQHAAEACSPANAFVHADVDRFTEFAIEIDTSEAISTNQMVAIARKLMPIAKDYLDTLRFSASGALVGELDRQDIAFIEDWTRAPDQRIAMLLPRESESRIKQDAAAIERFKTEQRIAQAVAADPALQDKADRADRKLRQMFQDAYSELTLALDSLGQSVSFGNLRSLRDLDRLEKTQNAAIEHAQRAKAFWTDPAKEWDKLLESEGISGELRDVLVKGFPTMFRNDPAKAAKVFEALDGDIKSCRYVLQMLTRENDKWKFSQGSIGLIDDDFARRFERAQRQMREDFQETEVALRAWHEAIGP
jgi:hypothetical protein